MVTIVCEGHPRAGAQLIVNSQHLTASIIIIYFHCALVFEEVISPLGHT